MTAIKGMVCVVAGVLDSKGAEVSGELRISTELGKQAYASHCYKSVHVFIGVLTYCYTLITASHGSVYILNLVRI